MNNMLYSGVFVIYRGGEVYGHIAYSTLPLAVKPMHIAWLCQARDITKYDGGIFSSTKVQLD